MARPRFGLGQEPEAERTPSVGEAPIVEGAQEEAPEEPPEEEDPAQVALERRLFDDPEEPEALLHSSTRQESKVPRERS